MWVLDAGAFVELALRSAAGRIVEAEIRKLDIDIFVPSHFDGEVLSALGRLARKGFLSDRRVSASLDLLATAPFHRAPLPPLLAEAWRLRHSCQVRHRFTILRDV